MDLSRNLEALGIADLEQVSLPKLEAIIDHTVQAARISKQQVLNTYLGWLREQFVKDLRTQEESQLEGWVQSLRKREFDNDHILRSFKDWQRREAQDNPLSTRRYLMIEDDLDRILRGVGIGQEDIQSSQGPKSRSRKNRKKAAESMRDDDDGRPSGKGRQRTGANDIPVKKCRVFGQEEFPQAANNSAAIEIEDDSPVLSEMKMGITTPMRGRRQTSGDTDPDDVTFMHETIVLDTPPEPRMQCSSQGYEGDFGHGGYDFSGSEYMTALKSGTLPEHPPGNNYVCKRCHCPGHWINYCPTNLDPSWDAPPDGQYRCTFCGMVGHHFATLCSRNDQEWSLTQQRIKAGIYLPKRGINSPSRFGRSAKSRRDNYRPKSSPQSQSEFEDDYRKRRRRYDKRERSVSPIPEFDDDYRKERRHFDTRERSVSSIPEFEDDYRLERRQCNKRERSVSPISGRRFVPAKSPRDNPSRTPEIAKKYCIDRYRPYKHEDREPQKGVKKTHSDIQKKKETRMTSNKDRKAEGRLSFHDEDVFMSDNSPLKNKTNITASSCPSETSPVRKSDPDILKQVRAEAEGFLEELKVELKDVPECAKGLGVILEEAESDMGGNAQDCDEMDVDCLSVTAVVNKSTEATNPTLVFGSDGTEYRLVTNPPYSDEVVRLFTGRKNPVINRHAVRKTAAEMLNEAHITRVSGLHQCLTIRPATQASQGRRVTLNRPACA